LWRSEEGIFGAVDSLPHGGAAGMLVVLEHAQVVGSFSFPTPAVSTPAHPLSVLFADLLSGRVIFLRELVTGEQPDCPHPVLDLAGRFRGLNQLGISHDGSIARKRGRWGLFCFLRRLVLVGKANVAFRTHRSPIARRFALSAAVRLAPASPPAAPAEPLARAGARCSLQWRIRFPTVAMRPKGQAMSKHHAIYMRVSTERQDTVRQGSELRPWAETHAGEFCWYHDTNAGTSMDRPGFRQLMND
jgi:hypothetical protein